MNMTKKLMTLMVALMAWLMPLDAVAASMPGDVNNDGDVDIADLTALIDNILGISSIPNPDVNYDGDVDIADVVALIDIILGYPAPTPPVIETITVNGVSFNMVNVEGGMFTMGATPEQGSYAYDWEYPTHQVTLSSYRIGETEVTQALWVAVMGSNPSHFTSANGYAEDLNRPVENVSWKDCQAFIIRLNELTGKHFRLPTEAEWEYAARGGNKSQGYKYAGSDDLDEVAWYINSIPSQTSGTEGFGTQPVATKAPNELGLYDMSGNVWEWCQDWFGDYSSEAQTNPIGPISGSDRILRGGYWHYKASCCRVSYRNFARSSESDASCGLRLVINPDVEVEDGHEWVDLGLPSGTLWATMNIGAGSPEEYGDYFAWGETEPKRTFNWATYKWSDGGYRDITKYCTDSILGTVDGKTELELEDDAAYVNWGPEWRIPSQEQLSELFTKCTWEWTTINGVNGKLVIGPNGNSLFFPAAGYRLNSSLHSAGSYGDYWVRTLDSGYSGNAYYLDFNWARAFCDYNYFRCYGMSVRAVRAQE